LIRKQVDRGAAKDAASYYIQASEAGGEPPGRWWGPGARALGFEPGQTVERQPYDLLLGERKSPDGTPLGRRPSGGRKAADLYAQLLAAEPHATAERKRELRTEAIQKARQSPLFFDLTVRHEAPSDRVEVRGLRRLAVAAAGLKLRAA
jgi:TrwC relaxase